MPHNLPNQTDASDARSNHSSSVRRDLADVMITRLNDSKVFGDLESPESQKVLNSELIVGFAPRAPRVASHKWMQIKGSFAEALDLLTQHPVRTKKEGSAFFFNQTELTGRMSTESGVELPCAYRGKAYAESVTAFAIDVDGTDHIRRVREKLRELGIFGILYTTHSHAQKRSDRGDYFRVIIPLESPFDVAAHGASVKVASTKWMAHYEAFANKLEIEELDLSAAKFVQMMYLPRRPSANAPYEHYVVAGRALTLDDMHYTRDLSCNGSTSNDSSRQRGRMSQSTKRRVDRPAIAVMRRHKLSDGFDVERFLHDHGNQYRHDGRCWHLPAPATLHPGRLGQGNGLYRPPGKCG